MTDEPHQPRTPRLRFPEFQDAGEWERKKLGDFADVVASGDLENIYFSPIASNQYPYPVYSNSVIHEGLYGYYSIQKYPMNSITITGRGTLGVAFVRKQSFMGIGRLIVVSNLENANPYFIKECWNYMASIPQEVTSIPQLTAVTAKATTLLVPTLAEQQKIAECLGTLDAVITAQRAKLDVLTNHKQGLIQQLFPAEGETVPRLRFPEFQDAGEWEEKQLEDVASKKVRWSFTGGPFGSNLKASDYTDHGIRIIQLQNIGDGEFLNDYQIFTSHEKADELQSCNIYPGDIILSKMGDPVARACLVPVIHNRYVMCSDGIRLVVDETTYSKFFIYSFINSTQFRSRAEKASTGSTRKRIGIDELRNLPVLIPSFAEQQKIAGCLSSLDALISAEKEKLAALLNLKQGLMQQLFPMAEEGGV